MGQRALSAGQALAIILVMTAGSILPAGAQTFEVLHAFKGAPDGQSPAASLVRDAAGNLYGTTQNGGSDDDGTVFKLNAAGHERVLFSFHRTDGFLPASNLILDKSRILIGFRQRSWCHTGSLTYPSSTYRSAGHHQHGH